MKTNIRKHADCSGFTLFELMVVLAVLGVLASVAIPALSALLQGYRLKSAVRELYSNIKLAKIEAIRTNERYRVVFNPAGIGSYTVQRPDGTVEKTVRFTKYDPKGHIGYGCGDADKSATASGGGLPGDFISYSYNKASFNSRGLGSSGYVYLANGKGVAYAIGTWSAGVIVIKKWNDSTGAWE